MLQQPCSQESSRPALFSSPFAGTHPNFYPWFCPKGREPSPRPMGEEGRPGRAPSCPPRDKRGRRARHKSHPWDSLQVLLPEPAGITGAPAPQYLQGRTRVVPHTPPLMLVTVSQTLLSLQNQPRGAWLPAWLPLPHLHQPKNQKCPNLTLLGLV